MWPSLDLMPVPPRWQLSSPAGRTVPPDSRMARRHPRAGVPRTGAAPAVEGSFLLQPGPVSSALLLKTQKRGIRTDGSRIKTGRHPAKTRKRLGRRRSKGPPRQRNRFATDVNLWQIGFGRIRCYCLISQITFTCSMFSWSRLGDLNPGPTHYEQFARPLRTGSCSCIVRPTPAWILRSQGANVPLPGEPLFRGGLSHCGVAD